MARRKESCDEARGSGIKRLVGEHPDDCRNYRDLTLRLIPSKASDVIDLVDFSVDLISSSRSEDAFQFSKRNRNRLTESREKIKSTRLISGVLIRNGIEAQKLIPRSLSALSQPRAR